MLHNFFEAIGRTSIKEAEAKRLLSSGRGQHRILLTWTAMPLVQRFSRPALLTRPSQQLCGACWAALCVLLLPTPRASPAAVNATITARRTCKRHKRTR